MSCIKRIWKDLGGNFGMITALLLVPLLAATGSAIDLARALDIKSQLQAAADAAVLGSINSNSAAVAQIISDGMTGNGSWTMNGDEARKLFLSQTSVAVPASSISVSVNVTKTGSELDSQLSFYATVPTVFMNILGKDTITVGGTASASNKAIKYLDIYMLIDNTPSMGLGATDADVAIMKAATKNTAYDQNCEFACHVVSTAGVDDLTSHYYIDKAAGAKIRLDVVRDAIGDTIEKLKSGLYLPNQFSLTAYTFGKSAAAITPGLAILSRTSTSLSQFQSDVANLALMTVPDPNYPKADTWYAQNLGMLSLRVPSLAGNGSSAASRQPVVILIGDGLDDNPSYTSCAKPVADYQRCAQPLNTLTCSYLKSRGFIVAVLYTPYLPIYSNSWYSQYVQPWENEIPSNMQSCASPGYFVAVSASQDIGASMDNLFSKIVSSPQLTN